MAKDVELAQPERQYVQSLEQRVAALEEQVRMLAKIIIAMDAGFNEVDLKGIG